MAIVHIEGLVTPADRIARAEAGPTDGSHANRRGPVIVLVRSVAMVALAGLGILVILPAVIAAQAATAL